jgi:hypothetical protein
VAWALRIVARLDIDLEPRLAAEVHNALMSPSSWLGCRGVFEKVRAEALAPPVPGVGVVEHALKLAFNTAGGQPQYDAEQFVRVFLALHRMEKPPRDEVWKIVAATAPMK